MAKLQGDFNPEGLDIEWLSHDGQAEAIAVRIDGEWQVYTAEYWRTHVLEGKSELLNTEES
jgi:hypothetical protein